MGWYYFYSTRLVFLVSGGPGRPPLAGHSVAMELRNKFRKQKNEFLIFRAQRVDTVSEYSLNASLTHVCNVAVPSAGILLTTWSFPSLPAELLQSRAMRFLHQTLCVPPVLDGEFIQYLFLGCWEQLWWGYTKQNIVEGSCFTLVHMRFDGLFMLLGVSFRMECIICDDSIVHDRGCYRDCNMGYRVLLSKVRVIQMII